MLWHEWCESEALKKRKNEENNHWDCWLTRRSIKIPRRFDKNCNKTGCSTQTQRFGKVSSTMSVEGRVSGMERSLKTQQNENACPEHVVKKRKRRLEIWWKWVWCSVDKCVHENGMVDCDWSWRKVERNNEVEEAQERQIVEKSRLLFEIPRKQI